jgi:hypothetical protein
MWYSLDGSLVDLEVLSYSLEHCTHRNLHMLSLSSSIHCSVMTTRMSMWMDTQHLPWCMSAADILPLLKACNHLVAIHYARVLSLYACVQGSPMHFCNGQLLLSCTNIFNAIWTLIPKWSWPPLPHTHTHTHTHTHMHMHTQNVCALLYMYSLPSDANICQ